MNVNKRGENGSSKIATSALLCKPYTCYMYLKLLLSLMLLFLINRYTFLLLFVSTFFFGIELLYFRMTLLLGPPSSGKTTLMRALTGKPAKNLKVACLFMWHNIASYDYARRPYASSLVCCYRCLGKSRTVAMSFPSSILRGLVHMSVSMIYTTGR
jgi:hypothetical protein